MRPTLFALLLIFAPIPWAQEPAPAQQEPAAEPSETENAAEQGNAPTSQTSTNPARDQTDTQGSADRGSPFEYEASEQISEDLSVSFPVDI